MPINVALLKHGYHNFTLTILEFCSRGDVLSREKHFFEVCAPLEYNILKTPGSPALPPGYIERWSIAQPHNVKVEVTDLETNDSTTYHAIRAAARALGIDKRYIEHYIYLKQDKPVLGRYTFKLVDFTDLIKEVKKVKTQSTAKKVEVTNVETKEITIYPSIGATARALGYRQPSISLCIKEKRVNPFNGKYLFKVID